MPGDLKIQSSKCANNKQAGEQFIKVCSLGHVAVCLLKVVVNGKGLAKLAPG
jgi:hypothetical protein